MTTSNNHDPLCPYYPWPEKSCYIQEGVHLCTLIAKVRSDGKDSQEPWQCGDCGNLYGSDVDFCPNTILDTLSLAKKNQERLSQEWHKRLTRAINENIPCLVEFSDGRIIIGPVTLPHGTDHLFSVAGSVTVNTRFPRSGGITNVELYMDL